MNRTPALHLNRKSLLSIAAPFLMPRDGEDDPPPAPPALDVNSPEFKKALQDGIDAATSGLKKNRDEAMKQLKAAQSIVDALGGEQNIASLTALAQQIENDENLKLLKAGKHDEYFARRSQPLKDQHKAEIDAKTAELTAANERATAAEKKLHAFTLKAEITDACKSAEVLPIAYNDVERAAREAFSYDADTDKFVMREFKNAEDKAGSVVFGKDGKAPKTVAEWLVDQQKIARHWWGQSKGGKTNGNETPAGGSAAGRNVSEMSLSEFAEGLGGDLGNQPII